MLIPQYLKKGKGLIKKETAFDRESISVDRTMRMPRYDDDNILAGRIHELFMLKIKPF